ncbi:MAG: SDR family NAD(P)-dependent oxidoreductase [Chloroflexi bacterium]|nr:SDR family NAD(P)-dependent oxidoreductase [Chloroflexota bacterium]
MDNGRLAGKIATVVGAGSRGEPAGTGYATAMLFAQEGAKVLLVDIDHGRAEVTLEEITSAGGEASIFQADVTNEAACQGMIAACVERYGGLDILFNNVAIHGSGMVTEVDAAYLDHTFNINLKSMMLACKYAIPAMSDSGGGSIINVASIDALRAGFSRNVPYAVTKAGAAQLSRVLAVHHGRQNIRVNCLAPGHIHGAFVSNLDERTQTLRRKAGPLGTEGNAWDVAWAAVFLASDEARWISGVVLPIDAGLLAATPLSVLDNLLS